MDVFEIILTNTLLVSALGFLFKVWIEKRLTHHLNVELEEFRGKIAKDIAKSTAQENWNHAQKMELYGQLYALMVEADFELKTLYLNVAVKNVEYIKQRAQNFCEKYLAINSLLHKQALLVEDSVEEAIQAAYRPLFEIAMQAMENGTTEAFESLKLPGDADGLAERADEPRKKVLSCMKIAAGIST